MANTTDSTGEGVFFVFVAIERGFEEGSLGIPYGALRQREDGAPENDVKGCFYTNQEVN